MQRAISSTARSVSRLSTPVAAHARAAFSTTFKDKERAAEAQYFNVEEEKLLRKLLAKVREGNGSASAAAAPTAAAPSVEVTKLEAIIGKYKVSEADKKALIAWRHAVEF